MRFTYIRSLFLLVALSALCSCQRENEYEPNSSQKRHTIIASFDGGMTRTTFESRENSFDLLTKWQGHEHVKVFCHLFDGYSGTEAIKIANVTEDGRSATFTYAVPDDWRDSDSYDVVVFTTTCLPAVMDDKLYFNASIIREPISTFQVPVYSEGEIDDTGTLNATFHHYYTYELLHINNTSSEDMTFTLLGFEEGNWFKQKGSLCIDDGQFVVDAPSTKDPVTATTVTVKAHESETIVSAYIPTGQPIQMARMVAQVNGQEVKSVNTKSSGVQLKQGHAYHMYAGWNGKELSFWSNEEAPLDVETLSATFDPATFSGTFTGAVANLSDGGVKSVGFRLWREDDSEDYVEHDAVLAGDNTFSLTLTYKEFLKIAGERSVKGTYKVSAFALKPDDSRFHGDILSFTIDKEQPELPTEPTAGNLIDLGLSVTWASCNVGAAQPQEVGSFFAWGEVSPKSTYDWSNYELSNGTGTTLKKYCTQSAYGIVDNRTTLEPADDAAYTSSQGKMRMPTAAEWQELNDKCVWTKITYENREGYLVASPMTGNAIFLPCNGFRTGTNYYNFYAPYYWTSDLSYETPQFAIKSFYVNRWELSEHYRFEGLGVRAVSDSTEEPTIEVNPTLLQFGKVVVGHSATKTVTVTNTGEGVLKYYLAGSEDGFIFTPAEEVSLAAGQSSEVSITFSPQGTSLYGSVLRVFSNASNGTQYIECEGEGVESAVPIPELVDMGLSVLWASFNLGADSPSGKGKYYAWGETKAYGEEYPENTYNYERTGSYVKKLYYPETYIFGPNLSKYVESDDHLTQLEPQDDAAHVLLGEGWRIPTSAEWEELINNAIWEQVSGGYKVTSTIPGYTGASIFLPYTGNRYEGSLLNSGYGEYWSSTLVYREFASGLSTSLQYSYYSLRNEYRWDGLTIRPVHDKSIPSSPDIVDLGLSVKWASCNLGSTKPDECGEYFAWGETVSKMNYSWDNYVFGHEASSESMTKYNSTDGLTILLPEDDVAHALLNGNWRMPTYDEWDELKKQCEWVEIKQGNAIVGYRVTSKINGASITLPTAGYKDGLEVKNANTARYWYSSLTNGNNLTKARNHNESCYYSDWSGLALFGDDRSFGMQIRPVYDDHSNLIIQDDGFVDMGLSVEWASRNIGAGSLDGIGYFFSWGDVQPGSSFTWPSYRFGTQEALTKYNEFDGKKVLDREDDIVYLTYKGNHRIPTKTEWDELWNNSLSKIIVINGRRGYLLTSKINNQSIFLPFTGYLDDHQLHDGMQSRYWSSSLTNGNDLSKARNLKEACYYSDWSGLGLYGDDRCLGMPIRGIRATNEATLSPGELIDLGLSVKWASCNIGASSPEESGGFYSWGELDSKSDYTWDNYKFCMDQTGEWLVKYNAQDGRLYLEGSDDIVHKTKGGSWRMPTSDDWRELKDNCQWNEATLNGVRGYHIVSKVNGNSIFLPRTGYMDGTQLKDTENPRYWSSSMTNGTNLSKARNLNDSCYYSDWAGMAYYGDDRYLGMPVRGVFDDYVESTLTDGSAIDMGVSVRWARTNVGADQPEGKGYFFGWGEVTTRIDYTWGAYKYSADGTSSVMKKYNDLDKKAILDYSDDAAYTVSSGEFRMPTIDEWRELMNNTTHEIKIKNGQVGYLLTSKINGNTIFLPFVGYYDGKEFNDGMRPRYWSSSLTNGNNNSKARNLNESCYYSDWSGLAFYGDDRYLGMPVRGVKQL